MGRPLRRGGRLGGGVVVKLGVIARTEIARGLAVQTRNFVEHMDVDRTLVVNMPRRDCDLDASWCPNPTPIRYDDQRHALGRAEVIDWMRGLDAVFTVETPYDWDMPNWCRELGVKLFVQGNPEFVRHGQRQFDHYGRPIWWWPTSWRTDVLPAGRVMPVPMPDRPRTAAAPDDGPLRVLHVIGRRAWADRNGTDIFLRALTQVQSKMEVTITTIDQANPVGIWPDDRVKIDVITDAIEDRWDLYRDQHVLVLPRRYGGLCLPALEAAACGVAVVMPDVPPNLELAQLFVPAQTDRKVLNLACGAVPEARVRHIEIAHMLDHLASNRGALAAAQDAAFSGVRRWSAGWSERYVQAMMEDDWT